MRISTNSYIDLLSQNIRDSEGNISALTQQITSGKRIGRPSVDPIGASQSLRAHGALATSLSAQSTLTNAQQINDALDDLLNNVSTPIQTAYDAAMSSTQTGLGDTGLAACAIEVRSAMERLVTVGNGEFNGTYLLAGTDNRTSPLVSTEDDTDVVQYVGDDVPMTISVAPGRSAQITVTGAQVFNFEDSTGDRAVPEVDEDLFQVMENLAQDIEAGDMAGVQEHMEELKTLQEHVLTQRGIVGAHGMRIEQSLTVAEDAELQSSTVLAEIEDVDQIEALMSFLREKTVYQSALAAAGQIADMPTLFDQL